MYVTLTPSWFLQVQMVASILMIYFSNNCQHSRPSLSQCWMLSSSIIKHSQCLLSSINLQLYREEYPVNKCHEIERKIDNSEEYHYDSKLFCHNLIVTIWLVFYAKQTTEFHDIFMTLIATNAIARGIFLIGEIKTSNNCPIYIGLLWSSLYQPSPTYVHL